MIDQHQAATIVADALFQAGFTSVRTVRPLEGNVRSTAVLATCGLEGPNLSVTVEILSSND